MWRSHNTTDVYGHYDIWHRTYPDADTETDRHHHHHDPAPIRTIPPLSKRDDVRDTPCVSLLQKGRPSSYSTLFLCNRPFSPFSGFYDQDDMYISNEYDVFGGESESIGLPSSQEMDPTTRQAALSSSLNSTTTIDELDHHNDIFTDDPFSIPHLDDGPVINRPQLSLSSSSCGHQSSITPTKRIRTNDLDHTTTTTASGVTSLKRRKASKSVDSSSTNNHHHQQLHLELADYSLCIFSPDLAPSSPMPVDTMLEYN